MSRRADPEQSSAFERFDASRASERAIRASRPSNPWIERERFSLEANAEIVPKTIITPRRGPGRPRKHPADIR